MILVYALLGTPDWLASPDYIGARVFLYPLFHANVFHLLVNCLALWMLLKPERKDNATCLIEGYVISCIAFFFTHTPMIGISNLLYAVAGLRSPSFGSPWWKTTPVRIFLAVTFIMMFIPQISGITHVVSFGLGIGVDRTVKFFISIADDGDEL